ncbi:MAG: hypothetical protein ACP5VF_13595, partial [Acidobacteriota bacterium]
ELNNALNPARLRLEEMALEGRTPTQRLPDRIRAHALICFIALVLYRVMRMRLKDADSKLSPERALEQLRRIQYHQVHLGGERRDGTSSLSDADHAILQGLKLPKPAIDDQLALL